EDGLVGEADGAGGAARERHRDQRDVEVRVDEVGVGARGAAGVEAAGDDDGAAGERGGGAVAEGDRRAGREDPVGSDERRRAGEGDEDAAVGHRGDGGAGARRRVELAPRRRAGVVAEDAGRAGEDHGRGAGGRRRRRGGGRGGGAGGRAGQGGQVAGVDVED